MHRTLCKCTQLHRLAHNCTDLYTIAHNRPQADTSEYRKTQAKCKILCIVFCRRLHYVYVFVYEFVFVSVFEYEYVHVLVHVHDLYMSALARRSLPGTQKTRLKKSIGLLKKNA